MSNIKTTRLSSKGQLIIPEAIRDKMGLKSGDEFVVVSEGDVIMLKSIKQPSIDELPDLLDKTHQQAKQAGLSKADLQSVIKKARRE